MLQPLRVASPSGPPLLAVAISRGAGQAPLAARRKTPGATQETSPVPPASETAIRMALATEATDTGSSTVVVVPEVLAGTEAVRLASSGAGRVSVAIAMAT